MRKWKIKWKGAAALFLCIAMVLGVFDGIPGMEGVMTTEVYAAGTANDLVSVAQNQLWKNNLDYKLEVKPTLRKFLIYGLIIIAFSGVCALIETLLKSVVTI